MTGLTDGELRLAIHHLDAAIASLRLAGHFGAHVGGIAEDAHALAYELAKAREDLRHVPNTAPLVSGQFANREA